MTVHYLKTAHAPPAPEPPPVDPHVPLRVAVFGDLLDAAERVVPTVDPITGRHAVAVVLASFETENGALEYAAEYAARLDAAMDEIAAGDAILRTRYAERDGNL